MNLQQAVSQKAEEKATNGRRDREVPYLLESKMECEKGQLVYVPSNLQMGKVFRID